MMAEFAVHGAKVAGDRTVVIGRCYSGPLRVGHVFRLAYHANEQGTRTETRPVNLVVVRMVAYQHELDEIDAGLTAELTLRGAHDLPVGWVLADDDHG